MVRILIAVLVTILIVSVVRFLKKKKSGSFLISVKSYANRGGQSRVSLPATR